MKKRICLWAVPRTTSTALMYSFRSRKDTYVVDEPLYGHYLRISGAQHPINDGTQRDIINDNGQNIMHHLTYDAFEKPVLFIKHMCHHALDLEWDFLSDLTNIFLIRDPVETIPSLAKIIGTPVLRDTGFDQQVEIYRKVCEFDESPLVIQRTDLLKKPDVILKQLCVRSGISFDESMLSWDSGRKAEDNTGNENWYHSVRQSTSFNDYKPSSAPFPEAFKMLLEECRPYYDEMAKHAMIVE